MSVAHSFTDEMREAFPDPSEEEASYVRVSLGEQIQQSIKVTLNPGRQLVPNRRRLHRFHFEDVKPVFHIDGEDNPGFDGGAYARRDGCCVGLAAGN